MSEELKVLDKYFHEMELAENTESVFMIEDHIRKLIEDLLARAESAESRVKELNWHLINEDDQETFPQEDGVYEVVIETTTSRKYAHRSYSIQFGWDTVYPVIKWRNVELPEEGV
jgi:hypothetical protein